MKTIIHASAGVLTMLFLLVFFVAICVAEIKYGVEDVIAVQRNIYEAMGFYVFLLLITGGVGLLLSRERKGRIVEMKKRRTLAILACSVFVLLPCSYLLANYDLALRGRLFMYLLEGIELLVIGLLITLLSFNFRDGLRLTAPPVSSAS